MSDERFEIQGKEYVGYYQGYAYVVKDTLTKATYSIWEDKRTAQKIIDLLNNVNDVELREQNKKLEAEKEYWEQSSKHRQRLLENSEKELRLHNAYLIDNNIGEDYQRWRRLNK